MLYFVTKQFTGGLLAGITIVEETTVSFPIGFKCDKPAGGSPYKVLNCEPARPGQLAWYTCFAKLNALPLHSVREIRHAIAIIMAAEGAEEVGSSDVNHRIFSYFRRNEGHLVNMVDEILDEAFSLI